MKNFAPYPWDAEYDTWVQDQDTDSNNDTSWKINDNDQSNYTTNLVQTQGIQHSCTASIERIKKGPADWKAVLSNGR